MIRPPPTSTLFPYTTLFRSVRDPSRRTMFHICEERKEGERRHIEEVTPLAFLSFFRSEEHTSELQSRVDLVCRLLLEKKKQRTQRSEQLRTELRQPSRNRPR